MKKLLTLSVAAAVALSSLAIFSSCGTAEVVYSLSEDGTHYIVSGVSGNRYALKNYDILSTYDDGEHGELPVTSIGYNAFMGCTSMISVTIPDSITTIEDQAFAYSGILEIEIPDSVTYIGMNAFYAAENLQNITVPYSVTSLGPGAFAYCIRLKTVNIEANIDCIYASTFSGSYAITEAGVYTATALTDVYLPESLTSIHQTAFDGQLMTQLTIHFAGSCDEWLNIDVFYAEIEEAEEEDGEDETVVKHLTPEERLAHFNGFTIECSDGTLVYENDSVSRE